MTRRDAISVTLKAVGIILFASAVIRLPESFASVVAMRGSEYYAAYAGAYATSVTIHSVVRLTVLSALIALSGPISRWLVPRDEEASPWTPKEVFILALRILGVSLVAAKLTVLISVVTDVWVYGPVRSRMHEELSRWTMDGGPVFTSRNPASIDWVVFVSPLAAILIGIYLSLGAKHFARSVYDRQSAIADLEVG